MKGKFFRCDCGSEGLWVEYADYFGTEISLFHSNPQNRSWANRIKLAWNCLKGKPYTDMVLLNDQGIADLVDHLIDIQNRDHTTENNKETVSMAADKLCGLSCGMAVDAVLEYVNRPDCSQTQIKRLISKLNEL